MRLPKAQQAVLEYAALGYSVDETAVARQRSHDTVNNQRGSVILKLGAKNMAHAIHIAHTLGLLDHVPATSEEGFDPEPVEQTEPYNHETVAQVYRSGDVKGAREMTEHGGTAWGGRSRAEGKS